MERYEVLCRAQRSYDPGLNDLVTSALSIVGEVTRTACKGKQSEDSMRAALVQVILDIRRSKCEAIGGCKQSDIKQVIDAVYGVPGDGLTNPDLKDMTCAEIHLYHMYFERLRKVRYVYPLQNPSLLEAEESVEEKDISTDDMETLLSQKFKVTRKRKEK